MDLFEIVNGHVFPSVHALMLEPFKSIWNNDDTENKEYSIGIFSYTEFMCSPKKSNTYYKYTDIELREKKVKERIFGDPEYPTNSDMVLCNMEYIEQLKDECISYGLFEDAVAGAEKLRRWCRDFDLNERTPNGATVLKPADINRALKEIPGIMKNLEEARNQIVAELNTASKTRGDRTVGYFER